MKILIVSDTHGHDENLEYTVEREAPFDMLIHCGDVEGREFFIEALADCPCCIVSGNNDFFSDLPREEIVEVKGHRILVTHGHYYGVSAEDVSGLSGMAQERMCDAVCFGHIHKPVKVSEENILVINPGSLEYPRQRGRKPSYAVMQIEENGKMEVEIRYL